MIYPQRVTLPLKIMQTLEAHPGVEAHHGAWRLTLEPWRLTLEWRLIMEREAHPRTLEAHPGVEAHPGAMEAHPRAIKAQPRTLEAHPGMEAHHGAWRLTLEPLRLTLEWRLIMELGGSPSNLGGSPWSGGSSLSVEAHPRTF
jgi:hypothetical protein